MNNNCSNLPWELGISVAADVVFVDAVAVDVVAVDVVAVDVDDDVVFVEFVFDDDKFIIIAFFSIVSIMFPPFDTLHGASEEARFILLFCISIAADISAFLFFSSSLEDSRSLFLLTYS